MPEDFFADVSESRERRVGPVPEVELQEHQQHQQAGQGGTPESGDSEYQVQQEVHEEHGANVNGGPFDLLHDDEIVDADRIQRDEGQVAAGLHIVEDRRIQELPERHVAGHLAGDPAPPEVPEVQDVHQHFDPSHVQDFMLEDNHGKKMFTFKQSYQNLIFCFVFLFSVYFP